MISVTHPESHIKTDIILKAVVMPDDIKWLQQFTGLDASCLVPFYESIQASSFIQSLMAWDHEQPVLQIDICEALFDDVGAGELIGPNDYTLRFQFAPGAPISVLHQALYNSVEYVFQAKGANRILMQVHKSNKILIDWMKEARFMKAAGLAQKPLYAVYFLSK